MEYGFGNIYIPRRFFSSFFSFSSKICYSDELQYWIFIGFFVVFDVFFFGCGWFDFFSIFFFFFAVKLLMIFVYLFTNCERLFIFIFVFCFWINTLTILVFFFVCVRWLKNNNHCQPLNWQFNSMFVCVYVWMPQRSKDCIGTLV